MVISANIQGTNIEVFILTVYCIISLFTMAIFLFIKGLLAILPMELGVDWFNLAQRWEAGGNS